MASTSAIETTIPEPDLHLLSPVLDRFEAQGENALLPALQQTQEVYGYLPRVALQELAKALPVPLSRIFGVVTFYSQFYLVPRARNVIKCCQGTACHVKGGKDVLNSLKEHLGIEEGETTADYRFTLESVACLGCCFLAPAMLINNRYFGRVTPDRIGTVLEEFR